jgi:hypothetical protein
MAYPTSIKSFTFKRNNIDKVIADDVNSAYLEITEIERQLGGITTGTGGIGVTTSTWGTGTFETTVSNWYSNDGLAARLKNIEAGLYQVLVTGSLSTINGTTIPTSKTLVVTTDKLSALSATTSAELKGVISDETGSGSLVFGTAPTLGSVVISAGSNTVPPLKLTSGTNLTSVQAGAVEYDGALQYFTGGTTRGRGVVETSQFITLINTQLRGLANGSGTQLIFENSLSLEPSTVYEFEIVIYLYCGTNTANRVITFDIAGLDTVSTPKTIAQYDTTTWTGNSSSTGNATIASTSTSYVSTNADATTGQALIPSSVIGALQYYQVTSKIKGLIQTSTGTNTFNPSIQFSLAPGASSYVTNGSYAKITPLAKDSSTSGSYVVTGAWA